MRRDEIIASIPKSYNDIAHAAVPSGIGALVILWCLVSVSFSYWMIPVVALTLFVCFGFEWFVHRYVLHASFPLLSIIHRKHIQHHMIYTDQDMAMRSRKELHLILMPAYAIVAVLLFIAPVITIIGLLFGTAAAKIVLTTMMVFFLAYEWLHYAYHHPPGTLISRSRIIQTLKENHRKHHNPKVMQRYNFNVTFPIFDWIMKTKI